MVAAVRSWNIWTSQKFMLGESMRRWWFSFRKLLKLHNLCRRWNGQVVWKRAGLSEDPRQFGTTMHETKSSTTCFKESRIGLNRQTRSRMTVTSATMSGRSHGTAEPRDGRIRHWMCCWKAALTMIGMLMVARIYRMSKAAHRREKPHCAFEKPKLDVKSASKNDGLKNFKATRMCRTSG